MAFVEIEDDGPQGGDFVKLEVIGDKLAGIFISSNTSPDNFNPGKVRTNYVFAVKDGVAIYTPQYDSGRKLAAADLKLGMQVRILMTGTKPMGDGKNPMKLFKILVDKEITPATLSAIKTCQAKQAAKPRPDGSTAKRQPPSAENDPFSDSATDDVPF